MPSLLKWMLDCFCILRDVTSFISRCRFSFQLNVLYGWFYWINSTVRLETRLEKRFENLTSYKRQKMKKGWNHPKALQRYKMGYKMG